MCGAAVEDASPPDSGLVAYALMPGDEGPVMLREGPEPSTARPLRPAEVVVHLLKANIGPGVLALPMHFAALGPAAGCATLAAVASQGIFGMWLLVRTQQQQQRRQQLSEHATGCEQRLLSFADLGELAYGRAGRLAVQLNVCALQLGVCAVFLGLVGDNLTAVLPLSRAAAVLVAYGACAALCLLPEPSSLSPFSAFGTTVMVASLAPPTCTLTLNLRPDPYPPTCTLTLTRPLTLSLTPALTER